MSRYPQEIPSVPEGTRRVAQAAYPRGSVYMRIRGVVAGVGGAICRPAGATALACGAGAGAWRAKAATYPRS
jgi:hypothetical protein